MGLTYAHRTFTKRFSKTFTDEVYELYRNGIVHGMLTNFDNDIVATKAWNRLFAVTDWARSRERQATPPEADPTFRQVVKQLLDNQKAQEALAAWRPRMVTEGEPGFTEEPMYRLAADYLSAWRAKNYGRMAEHLASLVTKDSTRATAGMLREGLTTFELSDLSIESLAFEAAAVCEVDVDLVVNTETRPARMRWIREGQDGRSAAPNQDGEWRLVLWGPVAMMNRASSRPE